MSVDKRFDEGEKVWWEKEAEKDGKRALMAERRFVMQFSVFNPQTQQSNIVRLMYAG